MAIDYVRDGFNDYVSDPAEPGKSLIFNLAERRTQWLQAAQDADGLRAKLLEGGHEVASLTAMGLQDLDRVPADVRDRVCQLLCSTVGMAVNVAAGRKGFVGQYVFDELGPLREAKAVGIDPKGLSRALSLDRTNSKIGGAAALMPDEANLSGEVFMPSNKSFAGPDGFIFQGDRDGGQPQVKKLAEGDHLSVLLQGGVFTPTTPQANSPKLMFALEGKVTPATLTDLARLVGVSGPVVSSVFAITDEVSSQAICGYPSTPIAASDPAEVVAALKKDFIFPNAPITQTAWVESVGLADNTPYTQRGHYHGMVQDPGTKRVISGGHLNSMSGKIYVVMHPAVSVYRAFYSV